MVTTEIRTCSPGTSDTTQIEDMLSDLQDHVSTVNGNISPLTV